MRSEDALDPDLRPLFAGRTAAPEASLEEQRAGFDKIAEGWRAATPRRAGVTIEEARAPGPSPGQEVPVRTYRPRNVTSPMPALLWVHGGGFRIGRNDMDEALCERMADELKCLVASVEYRLAPEHPFPAAVDDIYAALGWLATEAPRLGLDAARIAIGGQSAGGGLAAGVALMARDRNGPPLKFQLLLEPCVDDRHTTLSSRTFTDFRIWNRQTSLAAWRDYLGALHGDKVSPYAAPARARDLARLPPSFVFVGERDLLRDEVIVYAQRSMQADVNTELHVYPGAFHGFISMAPNARISQRAKDEIVAALGRGFA